MPECEDAIYSNDYIDYLVDYYGQLDYILDSFSPTCYQIIDERFAVIHVEGTSRRTDSDSLGMIVRNPKCYGLLASTALNSIGVEQVRRQPSLELYGDGVLIGIVDTGIDYQNQVFRYSDGSTRIASIWDQTRPGNPPPGFQYGTEYTRTQINEALQSENPLEIVPERDEIGHGTFLAGVAAGNMQPEVDFSGVAPYSEIIMVKLKPAKENLKQFYFIGTDAPCYQETDIMMGIRYLLQEAARLRRPIVILLGLGTNLGDHNGSDIMGEYLQDNSLRRSVAVVCAGGNEVNRGHHYYSELLGGGQIEDIELKVANNEAGFTIELWAEQTTIFSVGILSPSGEFSGKLPLRGGQVQRIPFLLESTTVYVSYRLVTTELGGEMIMMRFQTPTEGIWKIRVYNDSLQAGSYNMWLPMEGFIQSGTNFLEPNLNNTICEPGNVPTVITNATYNHLTDSLYIHSSRGYIWNNFVKPDITAPGVDIEGPYPGIADSSYTTMTGSSVGAAFTAGVAALVLEWGFVKGNDYTMNSAVVKNYMILGAERRDIIYPSTEWGWGILNAYGIFLNLRPRA